MNGKSFLELRMRLTIHLTTGTVNELLFSIYILFLHAFLHQSPLRLSESGYKIKIKP